MSTPFRASSGVAHVGGVWTHWPNRITGIINAERQPLTLYFVPYFVLRGPLRALLRSANVDRVRSTGQCKLQSPPLFQGIPLFSRQAVRCSGTLLWCTEYQYSMRHLAVQQQCMGHNKTDRYLCHANRKLLVLENGLAVRSSVTALRPSTGG